MIALRPYQEECVAAHWSYLAENDGNPLFVVPTGGGKSHVMAAFLRRSLEAWPTTRAIVLTHVQELIEQNHDKLLEHWGGPLAPVGIYSAGLGRRDTSDSVVFAGIQSVFKRPEDLGRFDLALVDECHLIPKKGQGRYRTYLDALRELNPDLRVLGYTATPFRLDGGLLHRGEGAIFDDIAYDVDLVMLVREGWLAPLVPKRPEHAIDLSGVRTARGEFIEADVAEAAMGTDCVRAAVQEVVTVARTAGRRSWLIFCSGIAHAGAVLDELDRHGVSARAVFGDTHRYERAQAVDDFRTGRFTALVNVGVFTTGFDVPRVDLMAVMRATQSAGLYVQIMGRGMRTFAGKRDCLVLDYGGNVERHGPINMVQPRAATGDSPPPMKVCPECSLIIGAWVPVCDCGFVFPMAGAGERILEHATAAATAEIIQLEKPKPEVVRIQAVYYVPHKKPDKPTSLRVDYIAGMTVLSEWVCFEHEGFARRKACQWWLNRAEPPAPTTVEQAMERIGEVKKPKAVEVVRDGKYVRVTRAIWSQAEEATPF